MGKDIEAMSSVGGDNTIISPLKQQLLQELEDQKDNYENTFQHYKIIEERTQAIYNMIDRESEFMSNIIQTLYGKIYQCKDPSNTIILWDIDDTLTRSRGKVIRPSLKYIHKAIHNLFPDITFGICSARGEEHITDEFYPLYDNYFHKDYIFSSRNDGYDLWGEEKKIRGDLSTMGYINKINAYNRICKEYPDKEFILIDDMIDERFEQLKNGIAISDQTQHLLFLIKENIIDSFM